MENRTKIHKLPDLKNLKVIQEADNLLRIMIRYKMIRVDEGDTKYVYFELKN